jgi:hypothetical protein
MTTRQKLGLLVVFMLGYMYECEMILLANEVSLAGVGLGLRQQLLLEYYLSPKIFTVRIDSYYGICSPS